MIKPSTKDLVFLREPIEVGGRGGEIKLAIDRRYPLEQIFEARWYVENGYKKGSVVVTVVG